MISERNFMGPCVNIGSSDRPKRDPRRPALYNPKISIKPFLEGVARKLSWFQSACE